ncbi:HPP family protein [soil metagenome]
MNNLDWMTQRLKSFLPQKNAGNLSEQVRACVGALAGLGLTGFISYMMLGDAVAAIYLVAPMGASAVLLFCLPASPLAQPWSIIGGNLISAFIGVSCAKLIGDVVLAAAVAGSLAIALMFALRCLHPPSGAVALTAVLGGPAVHAAGYGFLLVPIGLNSILMVVAALIYNNATGRRYPHDQHLAHPNPHQTADAIPTARMGFTPEDLDAVLKRYNQTLDVSRDDLESIFLQTEMVAYRRRFGVIACADIMSRDTVTLVFASELEEAWQLMRKHRVAALPVLNRARRVIGIVTHSDFLEQVDTSEFKSLGERMRRLLRRTLGVYSNKPEVVGQIMTQDVRTVRDTTPIIELVPLMADSGLHHMPVVDHEDRFLGIVTQSDLVAALYESRLAESAKPAPSTQKIKA